MANEQDTIEEDLTAEESSGAFRDALKAFGSGDGDGDDDAGGDDADADADPDGEQGEQGDEESGDDADAHADPNGEPGEKGEPGADAAGKDVKPAAAVQPVADPAPGGAAAVKDATPGEAKRADNAAGAEAGRALWSGGALSREAARAAFLELVGTDEVVDPDDPASKVKISDLVERNGDLFDAQAMALNRALSRMLAEIQSPLQPILARAASEDALAAVKTLGETMARQYPQHADAPDILGTSAFEEWASKQSVALQASMDAVDVRDPKSLADADFVLEKFKRDTAAGGKQPKAAAKPQPKVSAGLRSRMTRRVAGAAGDADDAGLSPEQEDEEFNNATARFGKN
jgi:hypothetical protein